MLTGKKYLLRRNILNFIHKKFTIFDDTNQEVLFSKRHGLKLKADIKVYSDSCMNAEIIAIKARNFIDFAATYDVKCSVSDIKIGALRRKGLVSTFGRDTWIILDTNDNEIGQIIEDNLFNAVLRKFLLGWLFPQAYDVTVGLDTVGHYKRNFNPFVHKTEVEFKAENNVFDRRLGMAAAILLCTIEGKQN